MKADFFKTGQFKINRLILLLVTFLLIGNSFYCFAQDHKDAAWKDNITLSVNAYSFSDLLMARDYRDNQQVYTLFNLLDWFDTKSINQAKNLTIYWCG